MVNSTPEQGEVRPSVSFKDALLQATFNKGRTLSPHVREIELGIFGDEARGLVESTLRDPQRVEFGKIVYVINDKRVLLQNLPTIGDEESVTHPIKIPVISHDPFVPREQRQSRFVGSLLHSHPKDLPPSIQDISLMMLGDFVSGAPTSVVVATEKRNILIFRGERAPYLTEGQAKKIVEMVQEEIIKTLLDTLKPDMSAIDIFGTDVELQIAFFRQIARTFDLKVFMGESDSPNVTLWE